MGDNPQESVHPATRPDGDEVAFQIIVSASEGRTKVFEAIQAYGEGNLERYERALKEAEEYLLAAHRIQTSYLQSVAATQGSPGFLLVHAQDILMSATSEKDLVTALIAALERRAARRSE